MNKQVPEAAVTQGVTDSYGNISNHIHKLIDTSSLAIFCDNQAKGVERVIQKLPSIGHSEEMILLQNPHFRNTWTTLLHEEEVAVRRLVKLTRLEQIAEENAVYLAKMKQRFKRSNIVGVDNQTSPAREISPAAAPEVNEEPYSYSTGYEYDDEYSQKSDSSEVNASTSPRVEREFEDEYSSSNEYSSYYSKASRSYDDYSEESEESEEWRSEEEKVVKVPSCVEAVDPREENDEEW